MREWRRQSHVKWYCRYHVVIVPKYRHKAIFGRLRKDIGRCQSSDRDILRELCEQFEIELIGRCPNGGRQARLEAEACTLWLG